MELENSRKELIGKYLSGQMGPREKAAFELDMAADSGLQQEVNIMAGLYVGLTAIEKSDSGHIDIELLVRYQENPSELDKETKAKIESHLKTCPGCAEEVRLCGLQQVIEPDWEAEPRDSFIARMKRFFFVPTLRLQPAVGLIAIIIFAIPAIYAIKGHYSAEIRTDVYRLEPGTRDTGPKNIVTIGDKDQILRLEFSPAVTDNCPSCVYDFELYDPSGRLRIISKDNPYQKDFAFMLTDHYFPSRGYYTIRIIEIAEDGNREIIDIYQILVVSKSN